MEKLGTLTIDLLQTGIIFYLSIKYIKMRKEIGLLKVQSFMIQKILSSITEQMRAQININKHINK